MFASKVLVKNQNMLTSYYSYCFKAFCRQSSSNPHKKNILTRVWTFLRTTVWTFCRTIRKIKQSFKAQVQYIQTINIYIQNPELATEATQTAWTFTFSFFQRERHGLSKELGSARGSIASNVFISTFCMWMQMETKWRLCRDDSCPHWSV